MCVGICVNQPGSYSCQCPDGYHLGTNGHTCQGKNSSIQNLKLSSKRGEKNQYLIHFISKISFSVNIYFTSFSFSLLLLFILITHMHIMLEINPILTSLKNNCIWAELKLVLHNYHMIPAQNQRWEPGQKCSFQQFAGLLLWYDWAEQFK